MAASGPKALSGAPHLTSPLSAVVCDGDGHAYILPNQTLRLDFHSPKDKWEISTGIKDVKAIASLDANRFVALDANGNVHLIEITRKKDDISYKTSKLTLFDKKLDQKADAFIEKLDKDSVAVHVRIAGEEKSKEKLSRFKILDVATGKPRDLFKNKTSHYVSLSARDGECIALNATKKGLYFYNKKKTGDVELKKIAPNIPVDATLHGAWLLPVDQTGRKMLVILHSSGPHFSIDWDGWQGSNTKLESTKLLGQLKTPPIFLPNGTFAVIVPSVLDKKETEGSLWIFNAREKPSFKCVKETVPIGDITPTPEGLEIRSGKGASCLVSVKECGFEEDWLRSSRIQRDTLSGGVMYQHHKSSASDPGATVSDKVESHRSPSPTERKG